jgi:Methylase involved in ubiquinone/menaquinone biosynthesis
MNTEQKLLKNWTDGAQSYSELIKEELAGFQRRAWLDVILENSGRGGHTDPMNILDVGTGPGFFAIILSLAGHRVRAIDCTEAMIAEARLNAADAGSDAVFSVSDSHALDFPDASFDLIVSRNVAWTLLDAAKAFAEWRRVLRPGGRVLIFDANWNLHLFDEERKRAYDADIATYKKAFDEVPPEHNDEMLAYRRSMPMCQRRRPQWDLGALVDAGFVRLECETNINEQIYDEKSNVLYRSTPMFMIAAQKAEA